MRTKVVALVVLALAAGGCARRSGVSSGTPAAEGSAAVAVTTAQVVVRPSAQIVSVVGTLWGHEEVTLSSQVEGQIRSIAADLGDHVAAEQELAQIDDEQLRARLREAEAQMAKARSDEARGQQLAAERVISPVEYETMKTAAAVTEAQRDLLRVALRYATVRSPITGAVARRLVSAGEYVRPGTPLFTLVATDPVKLRGDVPERFAPELAVGQNVQVSVDAFPGTVFTGQVARISPTASRESRAIAVEVLIPNPDQRLKPGFFANAQIVTRSDAEAVMVPQEALTTFAGVTKLFVVEDNTARERPVRQGTRAGDGWVEIVEGVKPGEHVATSGLTKLQDGSPVRQKGAS